jgi:predicted enzyme related to lactoylglutathione lyase
MIKEKSMSENPICFWELASNDAEKSVKFFENVFGWEAQYDEESGIHYFLTGESDNYFKGGGIFTLRRAKLPFVAIYIAVDDIDAYAQKVEAFGGFIVDPPQAFVPNSPKVCLFNDPSGVTFAILQTQRGMKKE